MPGLSPPTTDGTAYLVRKYGAPERGGLPRLNERRRM
jgi:hypothetical protein